MLQDRIHLGHDVGTINHDGTIRAVTQRDVEHGTVLGDINLLSVEHLLGPACEIRLPSKIAQELHRLLGDTIL